MWIVTDTSNFRLVCTLEFPYTVHTMSLIPPVRWTICVRYSVSIINHTGCTRLLVEWLVELELDCHALEGGGRGAAPLAAPEVLHLLGGGRDGRSLLDHEAEEEKVL